jgi:hypothetical protein
MPSVLRRTLDEDDPGVTEVIRVDQDEDGRRTPGQLRGL